MKRLFAAALVIRVEIVGDAQADRTASGLWPSDHAGVAATLKVRQDLHN